MSSDKVAIITGGASGMGLAVATELVKRGGWIVHLLDLNEEAGHSAEASLSSAAVFHKVNITDWTSLSNTFHKIFQSSQKLNFVFGNAGIIERIDFYAKHPVDQPPPELDMSVVEVNLKAVYTTTHLAFHYLQHSPPGEDKSIVLTASSAALYGAGMCPMYGGSKHGVIGFMRSIAPRYAKNGVRVNAICPGPVQTGLLTKADWERMCVPDLFTPLSFVANTVLQFVDGNAMTDAKGLCVEAGKIFGQAAEISAGQFYFRNQLAFCDEKMARAMGSPFTLVE